MPLLGGGANIRRLNHFGEIIWMGICRDTDIRDRYFDNCSHNKMTVTCIWKATYEVREGVFVCETSNGEISTTC